LVPDTLHVGLTHVSVRRVCVDRRDKICTSTHQPVHTGTYTFENEIYSGKEGKT